MAKVQNSDSSRVVGDTAQTASATVEATADDLLTKPGGVAWRRMLAQGRPTTAALAELLKTLPQPAWAPILLEAQQDLRLGNSFVQQAVLVATASAGMDRSQPAAAERGSHGEVSATALDVSPATATPVQMAASQGMAGQAHALPFADQIQASFGGAHDISHIKAHMDAAAVQGAHAIGAEAFASGDRVVFGKSPDLHTAAHEAAHVLQQQAGVQLKGGEGAAGDAYEKNADAVADRVVAGQSAADLLPMTTGAGALGGSGAAVVQRQQAATPAAAPAPTHDLEAVKAAAHDPDAAVQLDVAWMDGLPAFVLEGIDMQFSTATQAKQFSNSPAARPIAKKFGQAKAALVRATQNRLTAARVPHDKHAIEADSTYQAELAALVATRDADYVAPQEAFDATMVELGSVTETVVDAPRAGTKVTCNEGRMVKRNDFMAWASSVCGSAAAAKTHFLSMREVANSGGFYAMGLAATRFEAARADFEAAHPGYTFPKTSVGQWMRGLHQARAGIGMIGHAMGTAVDLLAVQNPNQTSGEERLMLRRFGGVTTHTPGPDGHDVAGVSDGRTMINLGASGGDAAIKQLGQHTAAGISTAADQQVLATIGAQFDDMASTSDRFRASLAAHLPALQAARADYLARTAPLQQSVEKQGANSKLRTAIAKVKLEFPDPVFGIEVTQDERRAKKAEIEQLRLDRIKDLEPTLGTPYAAEATQRNAQNKDRLQDNIGFALKPWTDHLDAEKQRILAGHQLADLNMGPSMTASRSLKDKLTATPANLAKLRVVVAKHAVFFSEISVPTDEAQAGDYKAALIARAEALRSAAYGRSEADALQRLRDKLDDPEFVFGDAKSQADGTMHIPRVVASPSVLQYLEVGFVEHDAMPSLPAGTRMTAQVFNREVMVTLAKYGWSPGSTYGDTMHFDFIEGSDVVPGGRSQANMKHDHFGPKGAQ